MFLPFSTFCALHLILFTWLMYAGHVLLQTGSCCKYFRTHVTHIRFFFRFCTVDLLFVCGQSAWSVIAAINKTAISIVTSVHRNVSDNTYTLPQTWHTYNLRLSAGWCEIIWICSAPFQQKRRGHWSHANGFWSSGRCVCLWRSRNRGLVTIYPHSSHLSIHNSNINSHWTVSVPIKWLIFTWMVPVVCALPYA